MGTWFLPWWVLGVASEVLGWALILPRQHAVGGHSRQPADRTQHMAGGGCEFQLHPPCYSSCPAGDWIGVILNRVERTITFTKKGYAVGLLLSLPLPLPLLSLRQLHATVKGSAFRLVSLLLESRRRHGWPHRGCGCRRHCQVASRTHLCSLHFPPQVRPRHRV